METNTTPAGQVHTIDITPTKLGESIRNIRESRQRAAKTKEEKKQWSQGAVAARAGITQKYLSQIETDLPGTNPTKEMLEKIGKAIGGRVLMMAV